MEAFNPKNGQIYTETTTSAVRSMIPLWDRRATGRRADPKKYKNTTHGPGSLRDMALRSCCWNIEMFMPAALEDPGWHYAGMIYRHLKATDTLTFQAWKLFYQAYPNQQDLSHHFRANPGDWDNIHSISKSLSALDSSVLTHVCAYGSKLDFSDLMAFTSISTLAALVLYPSSLDKYAKLTERHIRNWSRAVCEKGAFKNLRYLFMCECGPTDDAILQNVAAFPALSLVGIAGVERCVTRRAGDTEEDLHGWHRPDIAAEAKYTDAACRRDVTVAQSTNQLYGYACEVTSHRERKDPGVATISVTCVSQNGGSQLHNHVTAWFVRDPASAESQTKRMQDSRTSHDGNGHATKKRKVRQEKQRDITSLLETFG